MNPMFKFTLFLKILNTYFEFSRLSLPFFQFNAKYLNQSLSIFLPSMYWYLIVLLLLIAVFSGKCQIVIPTSRWDKEWSSGAWDYLENIATERARIAVIGGVFVDMYAPKNASVLDIGCGEGAISDFLSPSQKAHFVGIDFSKEAIRLAKSKRKHPMKFVHVGAADFEPSHKFDVIIFSEVLYYVDHEKIIDKYISLLNPNGIIIISIFHQKDAILYENIFKYGRQVMDLIDEMEMSGFIRKKRDATLEKTAFHMEVYRKKV